MVETIWTLLINGVKVVENGDRVDVAKYLKGTVYREGTEIIVCRDGKDKYLVDSKDTYDKLKLLF